jgi:ABC-2 type transport system permease protein
MPDTSPSRTRHHGVVLGAPTRHVWSSYRTLLRWRLTQIGGTVLPMVIVVQALLAAGIIVGFGFIIPDVDRPAALLLSTGTPTALLMIVGLVMVPSGIAEARADGSLVYLRAMPIPRPVLLLVELTVWPAVALPGVAVAVLAAAIRYDLVFVFDWSLLIGAALLITLTATAVGYAIAVTLPPLLAQLVGQVLVFFVLLFSPVTFHVSQLPTWLQQVHDVLPVRPAADLLRAGLAADTYAWVASDLTVLGLWGTAGIALSLRALVRRP